MFQGHRLVRTAALAARQTLDTGVTVRRVPPGLAHHGERIGVDGELEQRRKAGGHGTGPDGQHTDGAAVRCFHQDIPINDITMAIILGDQGRNQRREAAIGLFDLIGPDQSERIGERDRALAFLLLQIVVQLPGHRGEIDGQAATSRLLDAERTHHKSGSPVVQATQHLAEHSLKAGVERRSILALAGLGAGVDLILDVRRAGLRRSTAFRPQST